MNLLFIGNSATYVNEIPQTLSLLAYEQGYSLQTSQLTPGGYTLAQHADLSTDHGQAVINEIKKGYDAVILQDNSICIKDDAHREATDRACELLCKAVHESGAKLYFYVRPPTGKVNYGCTSLQQCEKLDTLFTHLSEKYGGECIYVNRAFAEAIRTTDYNLWGDDNAHTGKLGGYLTVCTFFKALTGKSPTVLSYNGLDETTAQALQKIADTIT